MRSKFLTDIDPTSYGTYTFKTIPFASGGAGKQYKEYPTTGDHVYISRIDGPGFIQIQFNGKGWIDVCEGMILKREYKRIRMRDVTNSPALATRVVFYTSWGELVNKPTKEHGYRGGFISGNQFNITNVWLGLNTVLSTLNNLGQVIGGNIMICNTDTLNTIWVAHTIPGAAFAIPGIGFPVFPLAVMSLDVDGNLGRYKDNASTTILTASQFPQICVATLATATCAVMFSRGGSDTSDVDNLGYNGNQLEG